MSDPKPPRWLIPMNRLMTAVQRAGIPTGPAMVLTVPGRKTGRLRSTPMTPFDHEGQLYTVAGYPGADWAANARAAGAGTLSRGRNSRRVRIIELSPDDARPVLRSFAVKVPVGVGFAKRAGLVVDGSPDEFEQLAGRLAVFRFVPDAVTARCPPASRRSRSRGRR
jgi:deazaflavin-dependent oxidoreductase (nitroreductase family)